MTNSKEEAQSIVEVVARAKARYVADNWGTGGLEDPDKFRKHYVENNWREYISEAQAVLSAIRETGTQEELNLSQMRELVKEVMTEEFQDMAKQLAELEKLNQELVRGLKKIVKEGNNTKSEYADSMYNMREIAEDCLQRQANLKREGYER